MLLLRECFSPGCPDIIPAQLKPVSVQTLLTAISMSAIATNGVVPGKSLSFAARSNANILAQFFLLAVSLFGLQ